MMMAAYPVWRHDWRHNLILEYLINVNYYIILFGQSLDAIKIVI